MTSKLHGINNLQLGIQEKLNAQKEQDKNKSDERREAPAKVERGEV